MGLVCGPSTTRVEMIGGGVMELVGVVGGVVVGVVGAVDAVVQLGVGATYLPTVSEIC